MLPPHRPFREVPKPQVIIKKKLPQKVADAPSVIIKGQRKALKPTLQVMTETRPASGPA